MIKNFLRVPSNLTFSQVRYSSYLYNGMTFEYDYPDLSKLPRGEQSLNDVYNEVKDKKVKHLTDIPLPYNFKGTKTFKPLKRAMDNLVLDEKKVDLGKVHAKLQDYSARYIKALASGDAKDLPPCESNLFLSVLKSLQLLKNNGFKLELRQSPHELKEKGLKENIEIFETMHIFGLNVERAKNMPIENYNLDRAAEGRGLLRYTPKPLSAEEKESSQYQKGIEPHNKILEQQAHPTLSGNLPIIPQIQLILRIYASYTTSYKLIPMQGGKEIIGLDDYKFRHVAVFENQLRRPPVGGLAYRSFEETIPLYRLQDWKLVDFDGVLQGNPLLVPQSEHSKLVLAHH